ncbi:MAG: right-handed parallel beta-helix repeat-containing protein [Thermoplasmatota archaeon]
MASLMLSSLHFLGLGSILEVNDTADGSSVSDEESYSFKFVGSTYYVDATKGNDSNSGTSATAAWKTVARVASKTLQPGDTVKFKRGEVFKISTAAGFLKLYDDGSANAWITIETYGTGAKPIIDGQDIPDYCIYVRGDYYIIRDLEVINSGNQAVMASNNYCLLENLVVHESGNCGIIHYGGGSHFTVKNCTTYNITNTGIALMGSTSNKLKDTLIENCTTYACGNDGISIHKTGGGATAGANHTIRNCIGYNNPEEAIDVQTGLNVTVENCIGYNNSRGSFVLSPDIDCVVRNCLFYGAGGGYEFAIVGTKALKMYNNIIINGHDEAKSKLLLISDENGPADNIEIYDNILVDTGGGKWSERLIWVDDMNNDGNLGSITIKNNIMISHRPFYYFRNKAASSSDVNIDGNCYYHLTDSFSYAGYNFTEWQTNYGHDINGMEADPLLVNYNSTKISDFKLKSDSPCIDRGVKTNVTDDFLSVPIYGSNDIGAMEFEPQHTIGEDDIDISGNIRVFDDGRYFYTTDTKGSTKADLSFKPPAGWKKDSDRSVRSAFMDVEIVKWNLSGDTYRKWIETSDDPQTNISYKVGGLLATGNYVINTGGSGSLVRKADNSGYLEFTIDTASKIRTIEVKLGSGSLLSSDKSTPTPTTGESYTFSIEALDNKGISTVYVEYWFGSSATHTNKTMTRTSGNSLIGLYEFGISIGSAETKDIHYKFSARNTDSKWINTGIMTKKVIDNDHPLITKDSTPSTVNVGNDLVFGFSFSDNIGIDGVVLTYWYDDNQTVEVKLDKSLDYTFKLAIGKDKAGKIGYCVNVTDVNSLWNCSPVKIVKIVDNLLPEISDFKISGEPTTGEDIRISLSVTDNVDVSSVIFEYWFGTGLHKSKLLSGPDYNITISIPQSSLAPLYYKIAITDMSDNENISAVNKLDIVDNDPPVVVEDQSDQTVVLGGDYLIALKLSDNIGLKEAVIDYWFGPDHTIEKMSSYGDVYKILVNIPMDTTYNLKYNIRIADTSDNILTTDDSTVYLFDDLKPTFLEDLSSTVATTGDSFTFRINVVDNIGVDKITVEYWYGRGGSTNATMSGAETSIILPDKDNKDLHYMFHAVDESDNWNNTPVKVVKIVDNDPPVINRNEGKKPTKTRGYLHFQANVTDNVGVEEVLTEYWIDDGPHYFIHMEYDGVNYTGFIEITDSDLSQMNYRFIARDTSNNEAVSDITAVDKEFFEDIIINGDGSSSGLENFDIYIRIKSPFEGSIVGSNLLFRSFLEGSGSITRIGLYIDGDLFALVNDDITVSPEEPYLFEHVIDTRELENGDHTMEIRIVPMERENIFIAQRVSVKVSNVDYKQDLMDIHLNIHDVVAIEGDTIRFQVHCYDQHGALIPDNQMEFLWETTDPIGSVDETGLFTAESVGKTKVMVNIKYEGRSYLEVANVTVYPVQKSGSSSNDSLGVMAGINSQSIVIVIMAVMMLVIIILSGYIVMNRNGNRRENEVPRVYEITGSPEPYDVQEVAEPVLYDDPVYADSGTMPSAYIPVQEAPVYDLSQEPAMGEMDMFEEEEFGDVYSNRYQVVDSAPYDENNDIEVKELLDLLEEISNDDTF